MLAWSCSWNPRSLGLVCDHLIDNVTQLLFHGGGGLCVTLSQLACFTGKVLLLLYARDQNSPTLHGSCSAES